MQIFNIGILVNLIGAYVDIHQSKRQIKQLHMYLKILCEMWGTLC